MANKVPFKSVNRPAPKKQTLMSYKFTFIYYESVMDWAKGKLSNTRTIETISIPNACQLFHDSIHKLYPNYYISNINIVPIVPGISRREQPTDE